MIKRLFACWALTSLLALGMMVTFPGVFTAFASSSPAFTGQWYGSAYDHSVGGGSFIDIQFNEAGGYAVFHIPAVGLVHQFLPATYGAGEVTVTIPGEDISFTGLMTGDSITGSLWYSGFGFPMWIGEWQAFRALMPPVQPGLAPGPPCDDPLPLYCAGDADYCGEILPFEPDIGPGYLNYYPDFRTHARRDVMMMTKYATARTECKTADWPYWSFAPLGLGDMSEADGSTPGTSLGTPFHPPGTHEYGSDIDMAYFQLYSNDNLLKAVCSSFEGYYLDAYHCVDPPHGLDPWRTAMHISHLSEHPLLRIVYVDWLVGPILDDALDELVTLGWIDAEHRAAIPLVYYVEGGGAEEYRFHHHHMHVSMNHLYDILTVVDFKPDALNLKSQGKFVTAYIELIEILDVSQVDLSTVALIVDGHTMVPAMEGHAVVSDYNGNGIPDLEVKFGRMPVLEAIDTGSVEVALMGSVDDPYYGVLYFQGSDTLKVK